MSEQDDITEIVAKAIHRASCLLAGNCPSTIADRWERSTRGGDWRGNAFAHRWRTFARAAIQTYENSIGNEHAPTRSVPGGQSECKDGK